MAYGFLLLAQRLEHESDIKPALPSVKELRLQAGNLLKEAIRINPTYINARLFQAILSYDEENYPRGLEEVNHALALQPAHLTALMRKGLILEKSGDIDEAINLLSQAREMLTTRQQAAENQGWVREIDEKLSDIEARKSKCRL